MPVPAGCGPEAFRNVTPGGLNMKTASLTGLLAIALSVFAAGFPHAETSRPYRAPEHERGGTVQLRTYDEACRIVAERFFDPRFRGVDWPGLCASNRHGVGNLSDAELSVRLNGMLARLETSHTVLYTPDDPDFYLLFDVFAESPNLRDGAQALFDGGRVVVDGIGVYTRRMDGRIFIEDVIEATPAADAGLRAGDEVVAVDGAGFEPVRSFRGKAGGTVEVAIRRRADSPLLRRRVAVVRLNPKEMFVAAMEKSARIIERDGRRIGYVRIRSSAGRIYHDVLERLVRHGPLAGADALVIDLRGRIGGGGLSYLEIVDPRGPELTVTGRGFSHAGSGNFRDRTVWLIDAGVRSGAELLAYTISRDGYGALIGETTAGAVVGGSPFLLPNRSLLYVAVADLAVDGKRLEGVGVRPDIAISFFLPYAAGSDPQMDRAVEEAAGLARADAHDIVLFEIGAHTVPCEGVAPMRCLIVNGEYFHDEIDGYRHIEGQPARIRVRRIERSGQIPADAGRFYYKRVDGS